MNKYTNNQVLKITLIIIGGIFFLSFLTCLGVGGFLLNDDSQNTKTEKIVTKDKVKKNDNKNKANLAKDKVKNKPTLSHEDKIKNKSTEIVIPKPTKKPTIKPTKVNTLDVQLAILRENFKNIADIKYKESIKTIEIIPHDKSFMVEAMQAYNGDQQALSTWNGLIKNLKKISRQIEDDDMLLCLVNNLNKENYILIVNNGAVVYDFIKN